MFSPLIAYCISLFTSDVWVLMDCVYSLLFCTLRTLFYTAMQAHCHCCWTFVFRCLFVWVRELIFCW